MWHCLLVEDSSRDLSGRFGASHWKQQWPGTCSVVLLGGVRVGHWEWAHYSLCLSCVFDSLGCLFWVVITSVSSCTRITSSHPLKQFLQCGPWPAVSAWARNLLEHADSQVKPLHNWIRNFKGETSNLSVSNTVGWILIPTRSRKWWGNEPCLDFSALLKNILLRHGNLCYVTVGNICFHFP